MNFASNTKKGFTLVELLVVISIIGMLASVVLVAMQGARQKGIVASAQQFDANTYHAFGAAAALIYDFEDGTLPPKDTMGYGNQVASCDVTTQISNTAIKGNKSLLLTPNSSCGSTIPYNKINPTSGSISFWVNPSAYGSDTGYGSGLIAFIYNSHWIQLNSNKKICMRNDAGVADFICTQSQIALNTWTHILISWGLGTTRIYVNGKQEGSDVTGIPTFAVGTNTFFLGSYGAGSGASYSGLLDQFAIYTQSLQSP